MKVIIISPELFAAPVTEGVFTILGLLVVGAVLTIIGLCVLFME